MAVKKFTDKKKWMRACDDYGYNVYKKSKILTARDEEEEDNGPVMGTFDESLGIGQLKLSQSYKFGASKAVLKEIRNRGRMFDIIVKQPDGSVQTYSKVSPDEVADFTRLYTTRAVSSNEVRSIGRGDSEVYASQGRYRASSTHRSSRRQRYMRASNRGPRVRASTRRRGAISAAGTPEVLRNKTLKYIYGVVKQRAQGTTVLRGMDFETKKVWEEGFVDSDLEPASAEQRAALQPYAQRILRMSNRGSRVRASPRRPHRNLKPTASASTRSFAAADDYTRGARARRAFTKTRKIQVTDPVSIKKLMQRAPAYGVELTKVPGGVTVTGQGSDIIDFQTWISRNRGTLNIKNLGRIDSY